MIFGLFQIRRKNNPIGIPDIIIIIFFISYFFFIFDIFCLTAGSKTENKTMKEKISAFIGSDFAHLTIADDINTLNTEYVNSTAGEGRINAVR